MFDLSLFLDLSFFDFCFFCVFRHRQCSRTSRKIRGRSVASSGNSTGPAVGGIIEDECVIENIGIGLFDSEDLHVNCEGILCKVCFVNEIDVVILPCSHIFVCHGCFEGLKCCPICRVRMEGFLFFDF